MKNAHAKRMESIEKNDSLSLDFKNELIRMLAEGENFRETTVGESCADVFLVKFLGNSEVIDSIKIKAVLFELFSAINWIIDLIEENQGIH